MCVMECTAKHNTVPCPIYRAIFAVGCCMVHSYPAAACSTKSSHCFWHQMNKRSSNKSSHCFSFHLFPVLLTLLSRSDVLSRFNVCVIPFIKSSQCRMLIDGCVLMKRSTTYFSECPSIQNGRISNRAK
eukprot:204656_1